jgi:predicted N-acetyltransferase YhbS
MPAMLLARLAVDVSWQGRGIGKLLLVDALERLLDVSRSVGFEVVVVDAIDADASMFYRRYGFTPFEDHSLRLFMTTKRLRSSFAAV